MSPRDLDRDFVGYGANPPNPRWPGGARLAINFVLNYEEGSEPAIEHGEDYSETGLTEVVAIVQPIGDEGVDIGACGPQGAGQQRGRALAIDIVVAVNQNDCPRAHGSHNDLDGGRHPGEAKRIGK